MVDGVSGCIQDGILPTDTGIHRSNAKAITEGHFCTAQAVLKQVGIVGMAMRYVL